MNNSDNVQHKTFVIYNPENTLIISIIRKRKREDIPDSDYTSTKKKRATDSKTELLVPPVKSPCKMFVKNNPENPLVITIIRERKREDSSDSHYTSNKKKRTIDWQNFNNY